MRFVFAFVMIFAARSVWAADHRMVFGVKKLATQIWDYSAIWTEATQSMTYKINLVPKDIDPAIGDVALSMGGARDVRLELLDHPQDLGNCQMVTQWQFEYQKSLPEDLLYLTLQGSDCKSLVLDGASGAVRLRFIAVPVDGADAQDFSVEFNVH